MPGQGEFRRKEKNDEWHLKSCFKSKKLVLQSEVFQSMLSCNFKRRTRSRRDWKMWRHFSTELGFSWQYPPPQAGLTNLAWCLGPTSN